MLLQGQKAREALFCEELLFPLAHCPLFGYNSAYENAKEEKPNTENGAL
jgi:hypothetical protein